MSELLGKQLRVDKRVLEAKRLLKEALTEYQNKIHGPKAADADKQAEYQRMIDQFTKLRGGPLFFPYLSSGIGRGALVELTDGSIKYDFITGIGVHYLGHSHPKLLESSIDAALDDTIMHGNLQQGQFTVDLLQLLVWVACRKGAQFAHGFLTSSGAMANENALKICLQKHHPASRILAFERCFAGRSLVLSTITDKEKYREGLPKVIDVDYIPFFDAEDPEGSTKKAVETLKKHLAAYPKQHACMMFELIQGEGGYYPGDAKFFTALMDILKENKIAILVDEIQTFGRTSELFAFQYYGLNKYVDVITIGKMTQVCATLYTEEYTPKANLISQTFTASSSAMHAARAILEELLMQGYLGEGGKIVLLHNDFVGRLKYMQKRHPDWIKGPFGVGIMVGFTAFDGSAEISKIFLQQLYKNGVLAFMAGDNPVRIRFLIPAGAVTFKDVDAVCQIIEKTLAEVAGQSVALTKKEA